MQIFIKFSKNLEIFDVVSNPNKRNKTNKVTYFNCFLGTNDIEHKDILEMLINKTQEVV